MPENTEQISNIRDRTRSSVREERFEDLNISDSGLPQSQVNRIFDDTQTGITIVDRGSPGDLLIPAYYTPKRDECLRLLAQNNDYILIAFYNLITKTSSILPRVSSINSENTEAAELSVLSQDLLRQSYVKAVIPFMFDIFSQDNGGFMEIQSTGGRPDRPLPPIEVAPGQFLPASGLKVLDSQRCVRTGDKKFPIIYTSTKGKRYKFHYTRIIEEAQLPSSDPELRGIGICALSRVLRNALQSGEQDSIMLDMLIDGMISEIVLTKPFSSTEIETAFNEAQQRAREPGRPRYRRNVFLSVKNYKDNIQVERIPLRRLPENFDRTEYVTLMMVLLSASLGTDARDTFPQTTSGATRADAISQARKARQKFIRFFLGFMIKELDFKFVPQVSKTGYDFVDSESEFQEIEARKLLDESHQLEIANGSLTPLGAAEQLLVRGYINQKQFDLVRIELERRRAYEATLGGIPINLPNIDLPEAVLSDPANGMQNQQQGGTGGIPAAPNTDLSNSSGMSVTS